MMLMCCSLKLRSDDCADEEWLKKIGELMIIDDSGLWPNLKWAVNQGKPHQVEGTWVDSR